MEPIKAQVIDVYNNKTDINYAHFLYTWQERGETVFLDSHSLRSQELLVSLVPLHTSVKSNTELPAARIPLDDIEKIEWSITDTGKKMLVFKQEGSIIEVTCIFPESLRIDPASGLADFTCSIVGSTAKQSKNFDYSRNLDFLKAVSILDTGNKK